MFRKTIMKASLIALLGAGFVVPSFAADVSVTGRVRAYLQQTSVSPKDGDSTSKMDMASDGRVEVKGSHEADGWTSSFKIGSNVGKDNSVNYGRDRWVKVENDSFGIRFGRAWYLDSAFRVGPGYTGPGYSYKIGASDNGAPGGRFDGLEFTLKGIDNLGLAVVLGMDHGESAAALSNLDSAGLAKVMGSTTRFGLSTNYALTDLGLSFGFTYYSESFAGDEKADAKSKDASQNITVMDVGVGYKLDALSLGLNYRSKSDKITTVTATTADNVVTTEKDKEDLKTGDGGTVIELVANYGIGAGNVHFAYQTTTFESDADTKPTEAAMTLGYNQPLGGATVFANYYTKSDKDSGSDGDTNWIAVGLQHSY